MSAEASIRRALALLECASNDWRHRSSDGSQPLHWTLAVGAAKAHLRHALSALVPPTDEPRIATADDVRGMAWWNACTEAERLAWLQRADSACPADAWTTYKAAQRADERSAQEVHRQQAE